LTILVAALCAVQLAVLRTCPLTISFKEDYKLLTKWCAVQCQRVSVLHCTDHVREDFIAIAWSLTWSRTMPGYAYNEDSYCEAAAMQLRHLT
jgi:hypothetical protein